MMEQLIVIGYGCLFFIIVLPMIMMWNTLVQKGDERRKMMLEKTCTEVFLVAVIVLVLPVLANGMGLATVKAETMDMMQLAIVGIVFNIRFFWNKKKYGG